LSPFYFITLIIALLILTGLAFYAAKLLFQLRQQTQKQQRVRANRITNIVESIKTIAHAVQQQQCNLSEGAIRLVNLLESLPVKHPPKCIDDYPALYELFSFVRDLPTHQERAKLPRKILREQDTAREEYEARLESQILKEVTSLRSFNV